MLGENNHYLNLKCILAKSHFRQIFFSKVLCLTNSFEQVKHLAKINKYSRYRRKFLFKLTTIKSTRYTSLLSSYNLNSEILIDKTINKAFLAAGWTYQLNSITVHIKSHKNTSLITSTFLKRSCCYFQTFLKTILKKTRSSLRFRSFVPISVYKGRVVLFAAGQLLITRTRSLVEPFYKALQLAKHRILKHALIAQSSKPALNTLKIRHSLRYVYELKFKRKKPLLKKKLYPAKRKGYLSRFLFNQLKRGRKLKKFRTVISLIKKRPTKNIQRKLNKAKLTPSAIKKKQTTLRKKKIFTREKPRHKKS